MYTQYDLTNRAGSRWSVSTYDGFAPQAAPVLQPPDAAAVPVAHHTLSTDRQVPLQPLVWHRHLRERIKSSFDFYKKLWSFLWPVVFRRLKHFLVNRGGVSSYFISYPSDVSKPTCSPHFKLFWGNFSYFVYSAKEENISFFALLWFQLILFCSFFQQICSTEFFFVEPQWVKQKKGLKVSKSLFVCKNETYPIFILNYVVSYGGQRGPFAVVGGTNCAAFVSFELTNFNGQKRKNIKIKSKYLKRKDLNSQLFWLY